MTNNTVPNGQVYAWLNEFCRRYFQLRDPEGTLELLSPGFLSVGTGEGEVALGKEQFRRLLLEELQVLPWPMRYQIEDYAQNQRAPSCWDCFCSVRLGLDQPEHGLHVTYRIRLTADGKLKPCLHSAVEYPVKGLSSAEMLEQFRRTIGSKPEKHELLSALHPSQAGRMMNQIGG